MNFDNISSLIKENVFAALYIACDLATLVYLTFFDNVVYTWWNWIIIFPLNCFLATIWPIYWGIFHWL